MPVNWDGILADPLVATSAAVSHSLTPTLLPGLGNLAGDPLFAGPVNGDYRLAPGSPCIDAGDNLAVPLDLWLDLDRKHRFLDDPGTPDTGRPGHRMPIVDMGAYEFGTDFPRGLRGSYSVPGPGSLEPPVVVPLSSGSGPRAWIGLSPLRERFLERKMARRAWRSGAAGER